MKVDKPLREKAVASVLLCEASNFEVKSLSGMIKMSEDCDIKMIKIGFFQIIVLGFEPSDHGLLPILVGATFNT